MAKKETTKKVEKPVEKTEIEKLQEKQNEVYKSILDFINGK